MENNLSLNQKFEGVSDPLNKLSHEAYTGAHIAGLILEGADINQNPNISLTNTFGGNVAGNFDEAVAKLAQDSVPDDYHNSTMAIG